ncbi:hypothetical protein CSC94_08505 [Zhengella mangrovi]|uniref:Uncharacterized protein n=1 Tax=Zhengella mangrovi TaxID=1982044 RepID=A0A2G1QQE8_9HYPH|nr:hypothetical protein CSC94_08505 [Zhengella mangrovi]
MVLPRDAARALGGRMKDMGGHAMNHGATLDPAMLAAMPADGVFMMIGKTCSPCHERVRQKMDWRASRPPPPDAGPDRMARSRVGQGCFTLSQKETSLFSGPSFR